MDLSLNPDDLNSCVQCGLCLSSCPTYRVTGDETMSPRGRIALMRAVQDDDVAVIAPIRDAFESCVQCRACEPACPSGVPFGDLIATTRASLTEAGAGPPRWLRVGLGLLRHPRLLRLFSTGLGIVQRFRLLPPRLAMPPLPLRRTPHRRSGVDVVLFTGCVMDAWQRDVHAAAQRTLEHAGFGVTPSGDAAPCCGALHHHAGLHDDAVQMAKQVIRALPPDVPIVVDSAGCGAAMKGFGSLVGVDGVDFAARVVDVQEFLVSHLDRFELADIEPLDLRVAVQDPCHLRNVQGIHESTRQLLRPVVRELNELDDDGMCCGAGGSYSIVQPELAAAIRSRKLEAIARSGADLVVSANPGCSSHLGGRGIEIVHPIEILDRALNQGEH